MFIRATVNSVIYWRQEDATQNFGDALTGLFVSEMIDSFNGSYHAIHLIGSTISDYTVTSDMERASDMQDPLVAFWCCGMRENRSLDAQVYAACRFFGARGPLTRKLLKLPVDTPIGDPAFLLPILYRPKLFARDQRRVICIPHFEDDMNEQELLRLSGADAIVSPKIPRGRDALHEVIECIASAQFVLAGALHGAVVAAAFGVPFAFFDSGHVDVPFKWLDFAASLNVPAMFARNLEEGWRVYDLFLKGCIQLPRLGPLLECAPFSLKPGIIERAYRHDEQDERITSFARKCNPL